MSDIQSAIAKAYEEAREALEGTANQNLNRYREECETVEANLREILGDELYDVLGITHVYEAYVVGDTIQTLEQVLVDSHLAFSYGGMNWKITKAKRTSHGSSRMEFDLEGTLASGEKREPVYYSNVIEKSKSLMSIPVTTPDGVNSYSRERIYFLGILEKHEIENNGAQQDE
jgi:hypothetical protein